MQTQGRGLTTPVAPYYHDATPPNTPVRQDQAVAERGLEMREEGREEHIGEAGMLASWKAAIIRSWVSRDGAPTPANAAPTLSITAAIAPSRTVTPTLVTRAALNQSGLLFPVDLRRLGVLRVRSIFSAGTVDICHLQSAVADFNEARTIEMDGSIVRKGLEAYTEVCGG